MGNRTVRLRTGHARHAAHAMPKRRLSREDLDALRAIKDGADIHGYLLAKRLRAIQQTHPELLEIGPLQMYYGDGTGIVPYFGAILTAKGKKAIRG